VFRHGALEILYPANPHILVYLRQDTTETVLIFPKIDKRLYFLSLGPYGFHWFRLTRGGYE